MQDVSPMIRLIYISSATREFSEDDLLKLLKQCRARNVKQNVTGMLLFRNGAFLQVLEGGEKDVDEIYKSILGDERNTGNYLMERKTISERNFPNWSMGFQNITNRKLDDLDGFTDLLSKDLSLNEIAKYKDTAVKLILSFK